jgi:hypothetical protein
MKKYFTFLLFIISNALFAQYNINFEDASKTGYASGDVVLNGISWNMTEALIGIDAADYKYDLKSARMRGYSSSSITMNANKLGGIGTISFSYWRYGTDGQVTWRVDYSTDNGANWVQAGSNFTAPANNDEQFFNATVNTAAEARIRIIHVSGGNTSTNRRTNIDNISITDYVTCTPPTINTHPTNATINEGTNTSFSVSATGTSLSYQWQVSTNSGTDWNNLTNAGVYSNVTTSTLNITAATSSMNGYLYRCVVRSGGGCPVNSNSAQLTVICTVPTVVTSEVGTPFDASATISWVNTSCYDEILVIATTTAGCTFTPSGDGSSYTANSVYAAPNQVVYKGTGTSVSVSSLTNGTTYYFEIFTRRGTNWTSSCVEVSITPLLLPCLSEGFDGGTTPPSGWIFNGITGTYTSAGNFGASSPSVRFDDTGDYIETTTLSSAANSLSFWLKGQSANVANYLLVEGWNGSSWVTIENISPLPNTATTYTYNSSSSPSLPSGLIKFRFSYSKVSGNLSFDDVTAYCGALVCTTPTLQTINIIATPSDIQAILNWTNGNGTKRIVKINTSNTFTNPIDGTDPIANSTYSGSGEQVIYNGNGSTVTVTGLTALTTYYVRIYESNCSGSSILYNTTTDVNNPISFTTTDVSVATVFKPGDLVFIGYDAQIDCGGSNDMFYLTNLVDIFPSTKFLVVNSRFEAGAPANTRTNRWGGAGNDPYTDPGYAEFTWNGPGNIIAGSIISFKMLGTLPGSATNILINGTPNAGLVNSNNVGSCNISSSAPDQIFIVQGTFTAYGTATVDRYNLLNGKVLYGLTNGVDWIPFTSAVSAGTTGGTTRQSRLPSDIECFNLSFPTRREVTFYNNSALHEGSKRQILISLMTSTNYTYPSATSCLDVPEDFTNPYTDIAVGKPFVITTGSPDGFWTGEVNVDWFNCGNWEGLFVPDSTIDVVVSDVSSNNYCQVDINTFSENAAKYEYKAYAKSVTVTGERLVVEYTGAGENRLTIFGNITLNGPSVLDMNDGNPATTDGTIVLKGNWNNLVSSSDFSEGNGTVIFDSTLIQSITTADITNIEEFYNIVINKNAGEVILNDSILLDKNTQGGVLTLTSGKINANSFKVKTNNTATGAIINHNVNSYVYGGNLERKVVASTSYDFPVGTSAYYELASISLSADADIFGTDDYIRANFQNPHIGTTPTGLVEGGNQYDVLLNYGFWDISATGLLNAGTYDITLNERGYTNGGATPYTTVKRDDEFSAWILPGTFGSSAEAGGVVTASRTGINSFSHHAIAIPGPLSIEILAFNAKKFNSNTAELTWKTANEKSVSHFEVQKATDGKNFETFTTINSNPSVYKTFDYSPANGINYYRLKIIETNGNYTYSEIRTVIFGDNFQVVVYPNPAIDFVNIMANAEIKSITIMDVLSREIISPIILNGLETQIDISNLAKGNYFIQIQPINTDEAIKTIKFVK